MDWKTFIELVNVLAWPVVVVVGLLSFRKPLTVLIAGLGGRVTKLSAFEISIELATLPNPPSPWSDPNIPQNSEMAGGEVSSTAFMTLFERIGVTTHWDYLIVDIKKGHSWLISRVFIFMVFLQTMRGVKCVVFVESTGEYHRRLIGLTSPDAVRTALNETYPWFEQALLNAMTRSMIYFLTPSLSPGIAGTIIRNFIEDPEMRAVVQPGVPDEWTQLGTQSIWEHSEWLTRKNFDTYLKEALYEWDSSHYEDIPNIQTDKRIRELICRKAPFIALVNSKEEFQRLLDRQQLLEQVVPLAQNEQQTDTTT
ncbi:hypothetical protein KSF_074830 [Reticulibacter mediterranei]|uniref:Uncharacterized protein n=1 Tax=Reticulibacter mediterranei TaxID=2778369 RepID=A0A8J3N6H9_9CHLR|nr:hypothetical protein [Reticulibacter mediterranei]GHO97435.1 hypothetical protein KSF_074830 [Reticulibacter mediterranei]